MSNAEFIKAWNASRNVTEFAASMGVTIACASQRAMRLRRKGFDLVKFTGGNPEYFNNDRNAKFIPTPEEIAEGTALIRAGWAGGINELIE